MNQIGEEILNRMQAQMRGQRDICQVKGVGSIPLSGSLARNRLVVASADAISIIASTIPPRTPTKLYQIIKLAVDKLLAAGLEVWAEFRVGLRAGIRKLLKIMGLSRGKM